MGTIYTLWLREITRFVRARSRIIGNLSMPFIWLVVMGFGLSSAFVIPGADFSYIKFVAPGIIGMTLLFTSIFSGISVIWEKQFGFLKEILVAPTSRLSIILGKLAGSTTISIINGVLIMFIAIAIGALPITGFTILRMAVAFLFMVMISVSFISLGLIIASRLDNMEGFQMIMSFLVMPLFFLSGAFFPLENTPIWMKALSAIDPLRYGIDGLRGALLGVSELPLLVDGIILLGFGSLLTVFASIAFKKMKI